MEKMKFRRIKIDNKYEFVWDANGKWVRHDKNFILESKLSGGTGLLKTFNDLVKGYPSIKQRVKKIKDIDKKIYYAKVWILTEANDLTILKNHKKRSFKGYHLDHIFPIHQSYKDGLPPEVTADIENLRFITSKTNLKKGGLVTKRSVNLIEKIIIKHKKK